MREFCSSHGEIRNVTETHHFEDLDAHVKIVRNTTNITEEIIMNTEMKLL